MKLWIKILIVLAILGIIGAALGYIFIYNKPHRDFEKAKPDFETTAQALFSEYRNNTENAQHMFTGKVIALEGELSKVETTDSLTIAVFALEEGIFGDEGIRCTMLPNHAGSIKSMENQKVRLKGFCSGYNDTDVILEKCSIIQ